MTKYDIIRSLKIHKIFMPFYSGIGHVLMFHRVCDDNNYIINKYLHVTTDTLEDVLQYFISRNIDIVTLDECYNRLTTKGRVKRFVSFTFDDGYVDNLINALPVFEKYNVPFTLFLATGFPDHQIVLWWYLLEKMVINNDRILFTDGGINYSYTTVSMDEKKDAFWAIRRKILESDEDNLLPRLKNIFGKNEDELLTLTKELSLSWEQLKELSNHPLVDIGAHTISHLALSRLSEDKVIEEINNSVELIEKRIKRKVLHLAYPIGSASAASNREFNITEKCNIKMAFTGIDGNIFKYHANHLYSLPRIGVDETRGITFIDLYINGFTPFLNKIFQLTKGRK